MVAARKPFDVRENAIRSLVRSATPSRQVRDYRECRSEIEDGDVLLFRGGGLLGIAGRTEYTHAALAGWWGKSLMVLQFRFFSGGAVATFASQLQRFNALIDVYRPRVDIQVRRHALHNMRRLMGDKYAWRDIVQGACWFIPGLRVFATSLAPDIEDTPEGLRGFQIPRHCSMSTQWAYRYAGFPLVQGRSDKYVMPGELAMSASLEYQFTPKFLEAA